MLPPLASEHVSPAAILAAVLAAFAIAAIVVGLARRVIHRSVASLDIVSPENRTAVHARARQVIAALEIAAFGLAALASIAVALNWSGIEVPEWTPRQVLRWAVTHGLHTLIIVAAAYITIRAANLTIEHLEYKTTRGTAGAALAERRRRTATLGGIVSSLVTAVVFFGAVLMVLRELSIDVLPLLTGAGIAGLAIGFGAQNLVRDVISGFFLILEDQVRVGDVAQIQNVTGLVEQVNLRTIAIRDDNGAVHVYPNGTITTLANLSKDFAYAVVDVVVPNSENLDRATEAIRSIAGSMQSDPSFSPLLLGPVEMLGIQSLTDANATIRVRFKTIALKQWVVAAELRRRIATGFAARAIRPFKQG